MYAAASSTGFPPRLFDLLRGQDHTLLLYADDEAQLAPYDGVVASARRAAQGRLSTWVVAARACGRTA
ncbi:hypothetical protein [Streptomyces tubercidicus]